MPESRRHGKSSASTTVAEAAEKQKTKQDKPQASLRARALRLLALRERSRVELERKLAADAGDPAELESLLDELTRRGWLSETRAAEQLIHARRGRFGAERIHQELLAKGVAEEAVAGALPELREGDLAAARAVWRRKFGSPPRTAAERARQVRFMQGRGFGLDVIFKVIKDDDA